MNNSYSFPFDVETGERGMKNWTYIKSWKGMEKLDIWESAPANSIIGKGLEIKFQEIIEKNKLFSLKKELTDSLFLLPLKKIKN